MTIYRHSGLKDATAQTSTSQVVTATRVYDAFGLVVSSTGAWKGPLGHSGEHRYQEDATGLQLLGHRYYDPSTGRFLTRDPIKDGRNWYGYCGNDPLNRVDPAGLLDWDNYRRDVADFFSGYGDAISGAVQHETGRALRRALNPYDMVGEFQDLVEGAKFIGEAVSRLGDTSDMRGWGSRFLPLTASTVLAAEGGAGAARSTGYGLRLRSYPNAGGRGIRLIKHGVDMGYAVEYHRWKHGGVIRNLHYHRPARRGLEETPGERPGRHRPWQGW